MKAILCTSITVLSLATAGIAQAAPDCPQLAGGRYPGATGQLAASGMPMLYTDARSAQLATSGMPMANTETQGTQLAASGMPTPNTSAQGTQLAAGGGAHPEATTNEHGTQLAASNPMLEPEVSQMAASAEPCP